MTTQQPGKKVKVFYSYSHRDEELRGELEKHLDILGRRGVIEGWHDRRITAGDEWKNSIDQHLYSADLILLLVSADFIASDYCYDVELQQAMQRHEKGEARVVPIILRPVNWEGAPFSKLQALPKDAKPVVTWSTRDEAFADISKSIQKAAGELLHRREHRDEAESNRVLMLNVPDVTNIFSGREEVLGQLHKVIRQDGRAALCGLSGVGKTRTAVEYVARHHAGYSAVFWTGADAESTIVGGFMEFAKLLGLQEHEAHPKEVVTAVQSWLRKHPKWLLVFDNVEDPYLASEFFAPCGNGYVLITMHHAITGTVATRVPIDPMPPEEGALLLLRRAGCIPRSASLEAASARDREAALDISREVGGLPLALNQAGAFIQDMFSSPETYLQLYKNEGKDLRSWHGEFGERETVTITFSLAFQKVTESNAAAADLLRLCAFLAPDDIPEQILTAGAQELGEALGLAAGKDITRLKAIAAAARFSLITVDHDARTFSVHRVVQDVLRDTMDNETQRLWVERAVRALNKTFPKRDYFECWPFCRLLIPHVRACAKHIGDWRIGFAEAGHLLVKAGKYLWERAQYKEAESLLNSALNILQKQPGPEHSDLARTLHHLANISREGGRFADAEQLYTRELGIWERIEQGPDYRLDLTRCLHGLALLYRDWGRYDEAEKLFLRAIPIRAEVLGEGDMHVAWLRGDLGELYCYTERFDEAKPLLESALEVVKRRCGEEHPLVGLYLRDLATYCKRDEPDEAEEILRQAMTIQKKIYGPEHLHVAKTLFGFATLYQRRGRQAEAEHNYKRALEILEKNVTESHPDYAAVLSSFALHYHEQEDFAEAERLYRRALKIQENLFSPGHHDVAVTLERYARLLREQGREAEARELESRLKPPPGADAG